MLSHPSAIYLCHAEGGVPDGPQAVSVLLIGEITLKSCLPATPFRFSFCQVTLAGSARHRDVIELALRSLVECLPSVDAVEVWQLDNNGDIRCVQGLAAREGGGTFYRSNERVNVLLHDEDAEEFSTQMEPVPVRESNCERNKHDLKAGHRGPDENSHRHITTNSPSDAYIPGGLVIRPKRTPEVLAAAPFREYSFRVGKSWIGADRLARGFALVLRRNVSKKGRSGTAAAKLGDATSGNSCTSASISRSPWCGSRSNAGDSTTAAAARGSGHGLSGRNGNIEYGDFTARIAREVGVALACVRGREKRAAIRAQELKRLSNICQKGRPSGEEARRAVLGVISTVLPGCRAYIGLLQSGGHTLRYESATPNSAMKGRELRRGEGVSFHYLDDPDGQINVVQYRDHAASGTGTVAPEPPSLQATAKVGGPKPPNFSVGDAVEVWYASSWLPAKVVRAWGHQCFDVRYKEFRETEAGVPGWRLRQVVTLEHLQVKVCWEGSSGETDGADGTTDDTHRVDAGVSHCSGRNSEAWPWPFVCAPLRSAGNRVGVLGVDGWSGVELGRPEEVHPEKAVVDFLREAGFLLADALYTERRNKGLSALGKTLRGQDTTQNGALEALIMLVRETVTFRTRIDVLETRPAEPGAMYCRGTWESIPHDEGQKQGRNGRQRQSPARVFDVALAPRVEELCITPAQHKRLGNHDHRGGVAGGGPLSPQRQKQQSLLKEIDPYQREMHLIARDGPGATSGLQARALSTPSRRGEIVGRFQRLLVREGGGRPSADGWFLIRVARALPEDAHREPSEQRKKKSTPKNAAAARRKDAANISAAISEDGDIWLLSEMCRKLDVGFMAIASRQQRAGVRLKAMDRVLNCCKGFNAAAVAPPLIEPDDGVIDRQPGGRKTRPAIKSTSHANGGDKKANTNHATAPDTTGRPDATAIASGSLQPQPKVSAARKGGGKNTKRTNATGDTDASYSGKGSSSSPILSATAAVGKPTSSTPAAGAGVATSSSKASASEELRVSVIPVGPNAVKAMAERDTTSARKTDANLIFSTPVQHPIPAETSDGRKGALVTLKDSRLAVLVYQGDKRVAVVEQPGGKQQAVPESEVGRFL